MFQNYKQLGKLYLENNHIKSIESGTFNHLTKLTRLNLVNNECINKEFRNETTVEITKALTECLPTSCLIPTIPNGFVYSLEDNSTQTPGDNVESFESVKVSCNKSYTMFHEKEKQTPNTCLNDVWKESKWPECDSE